MIALAGGGGGADPAAAQEGSAAQGRPNIVVIMSDDQTQDSMRYMPRTQELIGGQGATFPTNVTNWPLCCPSRATFLTGQYAHNHGVLGNQPPLGGFDRLDDSQTLPVWLQRVGLLHGPDRQVPERLRGQRHVGVPPGWSEWHGSKSTYLFYGYQLLENGQINTYGSTDDDPDDSGQPRRLLDRRLHRQGGRLIDRAGARRAAVLPLRSPTWRPTAAGRTPTRPARAAAGATAKPAARHIGAFDAEPLPQPPSYNEADVFDKPAGIRDREPLTEPQIARATRNYRCRAESLLAVDEGVERIVDQLKATGELDNTLLIYTSDNGFFHGEHRIVQGKNRVYEEAIRVPLMMRGPGIPRGETVDELSINADLAPTILDAAGAKAGRAEDGRSLLPSAAHPERERGRELLIEQQASADDDDGTSNGVTYAALRNERYSYVENAAGEVELYDLDNDPYQLTNQHANPAYAEVEAALASRLAGLRACSGQGCLTKPSLKLGLPRSTRRDGRSCRSPKNFVAKVKGAGAKGIELAKFRVGAKSAGHDRGAPIKQGIRARLLKRGKGKVEVRAIVDLIDGREATLQKRVRICR